jgi:flagellar motor protein MotB
MLRNHLICAIFVMSLSASSVFAQAKTPASKTPAASGTKTPAPTPSANTQGDKKPAAATADATNEQTIITIHGLCDKNDKAAAADSSKCYTTVGREEFDKVVQAVTKPDQQLPPAGKRTLAEKYVELLVFANAAKNAGVDQSSDFAAALYLLQLRTLAEFYQRQLETEYRNPSQAEIDAYYKEHAGDFISANVSHVHVPKNDLAGKASTPEQKTAFTTKAAQVADEMLGRATKGESLEKLQKEAYEKLGMTGPPPSTAVGTIRKGTLPAPDDKQMFALEPGGVFKSEAAAAYTIYKVDSKQNLTQDSVKDEISRLVYRSKMEKKIKELNASIKSDFDDQYFSAPAAPGAAPVKPTNPK